jgi:RNA polymerase subunit RPABC4/transcription elongation factor Spt4
VIILRREAKKQSIDPPDEVVHFIASKVKTNIRELRGYLTKIAAYSSLTKREITMDLAEEVLKDLADTGAKATPEGLEAPAAEGAEPGVAAADSEMAGASGGAKPKLSAIEERLSSLKARLSPILTDKKNGAPAPEGGPAPQPVPAPAPTAAGEEGSDVFVPPEGIEGQVGQGIPPEMDDTPVAEPVVPGGEQMPLEGDLAKCGNCGAIVSANVPECPECGVSFGGEWFECPECRAAVSADSMRCDNCGAEFEAVNGEGGVPGADTGYPQDAAAAPQPPAAPMPPQAPAAVDDKKKKKKKKKKK